MSRIKPLGRHKRTRNQRRQAQLAGRLEKVTWSDCAFFSTYDRQHRVRLATNIEIEQFEIIEGRTLHAPPARKLFAVVKSILPRTCMRAYAMAPEKHPGGWLQRSGLPNDLQSGGPAARR